MTREKAIKIIKEFINGTCLHLVDREALETLIPELAENENERVINNLISLLEDYDGDEEDIAEEALAWLENQKPSFRQIHDSVMWDSGLRTGMELEKQEFEKQKECLADNSKTSASEDERIIKLIRSLLENVRNVQSNTSLYKQYDDAIAWLEKQKKPKSVEDKELLKNILFQKKGITYDDYKHKNDPYVGLYFDELIKCLEEYDKERSNR